MSETVEALRRRKQDEADTLSCGRAALWARAEKLAPARDLARAVARGGIAREVIGSPSPDIPTADAFAVVTDPVAGGRGIGALAAWRERSDAPIIWWDHVVDPVQIAEARGAGADAVRITASLVDDIALDDCLTAAERARCVAIVVVSGDQEAQRALSMGADVVAARRVGERALRWRRAGAELVFELVGDGDVRSDGVDAVIITGAAQRVLV